MHMWHDKTCGLQSGTEHTWVLCGVGVLWSRADSTRVPCGVGVLSLVGCGGRPQWWGVVAAMILGLSPDLWVVNSFCLS